MPRKFKHILLLLGCFCTSWMLFAQEEYVDALMSGYRQEKILRVQFQKLDDSAYAYANVSRLIYYTRDSQSDMRLQAYRLMGHIAQRVRDPGLRNNVLDQFTKCLDDPSTRVRNQCISQLTGFPDNLFSSSQGQSILNYAIRYADPEALKLAGYLHVDGSTDRISLLIGDASLSREARVAARMALARMGDPQQLDYFTGILHKAEINDDNLMAIAELAGYVKARSFTDYLLQIILDDNTNCTSTDPDHPQSILCAYRAMEYVAGIIHDFPFGIRPGGDLDTYDYPTALKTVRQWIRMHPDYQITTNSY